MILKGIKEFSEIYKGNKEITNIFKGNKEIFGGSKVYYLGYGTSLDVKPIYDDWQNLTINNFFILKTGGSVSRTGSGTRGASLDYVRSLFVFSYNASTGILTCQSIADGNSSGYGYASNYMVLVEKPEKLQYLGNSNVNVASMFPDKYRDFTNYNFLAKPSNWTVLTDSVREDETATTTAQVVKTYNNSTGQVSAYLYTNGNAVRTNGLGIYFNKSGKIIGLQ